MDLYLFCLSSLCFDDFASLSLSLSDIDDFYTLCNPEKDNLCSYGHPNETGEVTLPAEGSISRGMGWAGEIGCAY
ncbi:unnamed protein product [Ilex paraguariensis]|uniref:Alfin N-terminal domain-containing protein n=1 Tax=Ilex paraguariensis TaxID=185542 RepID=A0ABC8QWR8_9AQUA